MGMASHQLVELQPIQTLPDLDLVVMVTMEDMMELGDRDFKASGMPSHEIKQLMKVRMVKVVEELHTREVTTATMELVEVELDTTLRTTPTKATETKHQVVEMAEVTEMLMVTLTISVALPLQDVQLATVAETSQSDEL